jgi:hypothetical protein
MRSKAYVQRNGEITKPYLDFFVSLPDVNMRGLVSFI